MRVWAISAMLTMASSGVAAEPANYCHDSEAEAEWDQMLEEYPVDPVVIKLAALRTELCTLVDEGRMSLDQAIDLFEQECRGGVLERRMEEERRSPEVVA